MHGGVRALVVLPGLALALTVACSRRPFAATSATCTSESGTAVPMFHGDRARTGAFDREPSLTAPRVAPGMKRAFSSPPFPSLVRGDVTYPGRAYASPLYAAGVTFTRGAAAGMTTDAVLVATSNGDVLALAASDVRCTDASLPAGAVLWQTRLVEAAEVPDLDGRKTAAPHVPGIALGVLSTPVLFGDRLYVAAMDGSDGRYVWKDFALDVASGSVEPGWPVALDRGAIEPKNGNGPAYFDEDARVMSQRSALALSPSGDKLYVTFGGYWDEAVGWIVAIDTAAAVVAKSFSAAPDPLMEKGALARHANGGMWAPGGPAIDTDGRVYVTTGNSPEGAGPSAGTWGNSMLRFTPELALDATYTPWDYCALDERDVDIAGSSVVLLPGDRAVLGGKAGVVYLLDTKALTRGATARPPCAQSFEDAAHDRSLFSTEPREPYCAGYSTTDPCLAPTPGTRCVAGPLPVFGPLGDDAAIDHAKMRSAPAYHRARDGSGFLFVAGSTKAARCSADVVPPSLARLRVLSDHLALDATDSEIRFVNPGSPIVTSDAGDAPVVWVIDQNAKRTDPLLDPATPTPILYAVDGSTMKVLWRSEPLGPSGKYTTPVVSHGVVYVASDRLIAFVTQ